MNDSYLVQSIAGEYRRYKKLADAAISRLSDDQFSQNIGDVSVAMYVKHVGGNLRSRFVDFMNSDGEKPWRNRDSEFEHANMNRGSILQLWDSGWASLNAQPDNLNDGDLERIVKIRGLDLTVAAALARSLSHVAYHVGEIVLLSKITLGDQWVSLSIPKGKSDEFNRNPSG